MSARGPAKRPLREHGAGGGPFRQVVASSHGSDAAHRRLGRLARPGATHSAPGTPDLSRSASFTYNAKHPLASEAAQPGSPLALVTERRRTAPWATRRPPNARSKPCLFTLLATGLALGRGSPGPDGRPGPGGCRRQGRLPGASGLAARASGQAGWPATGRRASPGDPGPRRPRGLFRGSLSRKACTMTGPRRRRCVSCSLFFSRDGRRVPGLGRGPQKAAWACPWPAGGVRATGPRMNGKPPLAA